MYVVHIYVYTLLVYLRGSIHILSMKRKEKKNQAKNIYTYIHIYFKS